MSLNIKDPKRRPYKKLPLEEIKKKLTPLQFKVTQLGQREPAYENEYWNNRRQGIYVDIVSGEPLFCTKDQFNAKTGWPTFRKPLSMDQIVLLPDGTTDRLQVRSKIAESHLGYLEEDETSPSRQHFSVNSAALRFIQVRDLSEEGYGLFLSLFNDD